jgi:hypothetical protein
VSASLTNTTKRPSAEMPAGAVAIGLGTFGGRRDQLGRARLQVLDEDVLLAVCVARDQVAGAAAEQDRSCVPGGDGAGAGVVARRPVRATDAKVACVTAMRFSRLAVVVPGYCARALTLSGSLRRASQPEPSRLSLSARRARAGRPGRTCLSAGNFSLPARSRRRHAMRI